MKNLTVHDVYKAMVAKGVKIENHNSDLHVPMNSDTVEILANYAFRSNITTFTNNDDGMIWFDIPFAFDPWWEERGMK